jgi:hypothetical protein
MLKFNTLYIKLLEDIGGGDAGAVATGGSNTTTGAFGPGQSHPSQIGKSGDFYAPGDARNLFGTKIQGKNKKMPKFKPPGFKKGKIIRRTLPTM